MCGRIHLPRKQGRINVLWPAKDVLLHPPFVFHIDDALSSGSSLIYSWAGAGLIWQSSFLAV
jgi:hypothetical protein